MRNLKFRSDASLTLSPRTKSRNGYWLIPVLVLGTGAIYGALQFDQRGGHELPSGDRASDALSLPLALPPANAYLARDDVSSPQLAIPASTAATTGPLKVALRGAEALEDLRPGTGKATSTAPTTAGADDESELQPESPQGRWLVHDVQPGDTLSRVFKTNGLSPSLLNRIVRSGKPAEKLAEIKPGQTIRIHLDEDQHFKELLYEIDPTRKLRATLDGDTVSTTLEQRTANQRTGEVSGTIESSLFGSAREAGLSDALILDLANIFAWDIDFALEIRSGDRFSVVFAEQWLDGERLGDGPILAAEFVNQGKVYQAIRFEDPSGSAAYYTPDGKSMRKAFLRAPVDFRRISSHFQKERWHPVLGKKRPHRGVDYAAAIGTEVRASGNGKVAFVGRKSGYGKTIILQHAHRYSTLYAHLNGYRKGLKQGSKVRQGQVIGYVGKTGMATGPHLHYEFRVAGTHRNPLTVKLPVAEPIAKRHLRAFKQSAAPLLSRLESLSRTMVADAQ